MNDALQAVFDQPIVYVGGAKKKRLCGVRSSIMLLTKNPNNVMMCVENDFV